MTNTQRVITADFDGANNPESNIVHAVASNIRRTGSGPNHAITPRSRRQAATDKQNHRLTFATILATVRYDNICRLKDRAFLSNRLAKTLGGAARLACYRVKTSAITALVAHDAARLYSLEFSSVEPILGVAFVGGGKLHVMPSGLDKQVRRAIREQLIAALEITDNSRAEGGAR